MYTCYIDDNLFYDDTADSSGLSLTSAVLTMNLGAAGSFTFTVPPCNLYYGEFNKLKSYVDVYRDGTLLWSGRVFGQQADLYNNHQITCEGLLAVLNDAIVRPVVYQGYMSDVLSDMIANYNDQVDSEKQITIRTNDFSEEWVYRNWSNYETTYTRLSKLVEDFGGYLYLEKTDDGLMLDWIDAISTQSTQTIEVGENLLDITQESSSEDIITVLIPLGYEIENDDGSTTRLTIEDVNDDLDYIEDADAIAEFGRIVGVNIWDDVTVNTNLLSKGQAWLAAYNHSNVSINVSAADLAAFDSSISYFAIGENIRVISDIHGVDDYFLCEEICIDLMDPAGNSLTLNNSIKGYIGAVKKAESDLYTRTENIKNDVVGVAQDVVEVNESLISTIEQTASSITSSVEARITAGDNNVLSQAKTLINQNAEAIEILAEKNETQELWITVDADDGVTIGRSDSDIKSVQDNDSYQFVDKSGNVLLTLDTDGLHSLLTEVTGQITYSDDSLEQWAMRKGSYISGIGVNLDDVWIGG